jgi:hypothetical protein
MARTGSLVWKFDRFARSVSHLLRALETFRSLGIEFVSLSEQVDTSTPMGKMVFTVRASILGSGATASYRQNSMIFSATPYLLAALCSGICVKC